MTDRGVGVWERDAEREREEGNTVSEVKTKDKWWLKEIEGEKWRRRGRRMRQQQSTMFVFVIMHKCMLVLISVKKQSERDWKRRKTANGNPLIRTWKQQQLSRESEEQQKDVTDNYSEHGSIQHKHPCVLLSRWVTLKIRRHLFSCFSSSKRQSVKNKQRINRHFLLY